LTQPTNFLFPKGVVDGERPLAILPAIVLIGNLESDLQFYLKAFSKKNPNKV
jgi:hypothetical protein